MYENEISKAKRLIIPLVIVQIIVILRFVALILILIHGCNNYFAPSEELVKSYDSPTGTYTVNFYLIDGGATTSWAVEAMVTYNSCSKDNEKTIYYQYGTDETRLEWLDEHTVMINEKVKLDVRHDKYKSNDHEFQSENG